MLGVICSIYYQEPEPSQRGADIDGIKNILSIELPPWPLCAVEWGSGDGAARRFSSLVFFNFEARWGRISVLTSVTFVHFRSFVHLSRRRELWGSKFDSTYSIAPLYLLGVSLPLLYEPTRCAVLSFRGATPLLTLGGFYGSPEALAPPKKGTKRCDFGSLMIGDNTVCFGGNWTISWGRDNSEVTL